MIACTALAFSAVPIHICFLHLFLFCLRFVFVGDGSAEYDDFSEFCRRLDEYNLFDTIPDDRDVTLFAPDDNTFNTIDTSDLNAEEWTSLLLINILPELKTFDSLECDDKVNTLHGEETETLCAANFVFNLRRLQRGEEKFQAGDGNTLDDLPKLSGETFYASNGNYRASIIPYTGALILPKDFAPDDVDDQPSAQPTAATPPSDRPTNTAATATPTALPTKEPTAAPTKERTTLPTEEPTKEPTKEPTSQPITDSPTETPPTETPTELTDSPTKAPPTETPDGND